MTAYWKSPEKWICPNHLRPVILHAMMPRCTFSNCNSIRPIAKSENIIHLSDKMYACSWFKCKRGSNGKVGIKRARSKYCSIQCKNDNARYRFKMRKKSKSVV